MENNSLPDFMKYKDGYTSEKFVDKISRVAKRAGAKFVYVSLILYYTLQSDNVSLKDKAIIIGAWAISSVLLTSSLTPFP